MISPRIIAASLALAATTLAAPAFADYTAIDAEFQAQRGRIEQGIRSGQITRHEAVSLRAEQDRIARLIARARSDGRVNPYERREIEQAQAVASQRIYAEKHDRENVRTAEAPRHRFWQRPRWWN
jgi:uncharacterized membrane protein YebE (DUF533 family)